MSEFKTYEQRMAERNETDRAKAMATRSAVKPTITASRVAGGVQLVIVNPTSDMRPTMDAQGFTLSVDLSNTYSATFATPETLAVAQNSLRGFFGR